MTQNHICQFAMLSVVIKMRAAGGFNYEISLTWKRFGFYFLKKSPFQKSKRKNLCKMHSAFSNHLLLKGRATPESYKSEVKIRLPMKFDYLLTLIAWERVNLWVGLSPSFPCHWNKCDSVCLVLPCTIRQELHHDVFQVNFGPIFHK